jgi:integrase
MSLLVELDRYLSVRRSLGAGLRTDERRLRSFATFADCEGTVYVKTDLVLRWLQTLTAASPATRVARYRAVRIFAEWLHGLDPNHESPPRGFMLGHYQRVHPYIYSETEIAAIVEHARMLPSIYGMRGLTCSTLFGLIAATGLRVSEALSLDSADLDAEHGVLRVRRGKLGKERLLPLDPSVLLRLERYSAERDRLLGRRSQAFFVTCKGARLGYCGARYSFVEVCQRIGLRKPWPIQQPGQRPRIHDLRHTFAVRTLIGWYRSGKGPAREMIKLTTYLGHDSPKYTYWYLEAVPELLELASARVRSVALEEIGQ